MSDADALRMAFRADPPLSKRQRRAMITRAHALSPGRILIKLLLVPVVTVAVTLAIYIRTSPYEQQDALRHLAAMAGCDTAAAMRLAPANKGQIGYHARNDKDGNSVACDEGLAQRPPAPAAGPDMIPAMPTDPQAPEMRGADGAKFVKP